MSNTKAKRHTHKYYRIEIAGTPHWACGLPNCNHYMPKHMEKLVPGKASICWECGNEFILDELAMAEDKPRCLSCRSGINNDDNVDVSARLADLIRDKNL